MLVLQGAFSTDRLLVWAETTTEDQFAGPSRRVQTGKQRARTAKAREPVAHTFGAGTPLLTRTLRSVGIKRPQGDERWIAWLPSAGEPLASTALLREQRLVAEPVLSPWMVDVLPFECDRWTDLMAACAGGDVLTPGVIVGQSLRYWVEAMRFAAAIVVRQQYIPGIESRTDGVYACWQPVSGGAEATRFAALVRSMPSACRALFVAGAEPTSISPSALLDRFLLLACDRMVRESLNSTTAAGGRSQSAGREFDSIHDEWLQALRAPSGRMVGVGDLEKQVREWRRPLTVTETGPVRLCFRLEEPGLETENGAGPWRVEYLLQPTDDPSLLVPAADAWDGSTLIRRPQFRPREYLLVSLGYAGRIVPEVQASLKSAPPSGYEIDTAGAHRFLTEQAWLLQGSGFGVLLPAWWTGKGTKLRLSSRAVVRSPKMQNRAGLSMQTLVEVDWQAALGGQPISLKELQALAAQKTGLVRLRGQWVELDPDEIQAAIRSWQRKEKRTVRDVIRIALGGAGDGEIPVEDVAADGWIAELLNHLQQPHSINVDDPPPGLDATMRPYQQRGYSWMGFLGRLGMGACLADDMGLGKTLQVLALIVRERREAGEDAQPWLVVCPTSVLGNWQREASRFAPQLAVAIHHGPGRARDEEFARQAQEQAIVLTSYSLLFRDLDTLQKTPWAGVVLDEAQNIKNPETRSAKAARSVPAERRLALTGTPVENHVGDLWSIMEFLNPGYLGTQADFRRRFFLPIQSGENADASERLKKITGPFILRRLKTDRSVIADLPEKLEMKTYCTLTREQASLYEAVTREAMEQIEEAEGIQRRGLVLATMLKLKQVCNHPAQFLGDHSTIPGRSGKLTRLVEMLEEALAEDDRALIFTQFTEMGGILRKHLQESFGEEVFFLHGGVPRPQRDRMVERFQAGGPHLFILSVKAGGTGLNLTAASRVFHFDRWWNPAVENQATDRAFRIGQTKRVQVHKMVCGGTLEERIDEMIDRKQAMAQRIVGTGEDWLTELSTADLKDLFRLRREAMED